MKLSPIVLFAYNRPEHTKQTLSALQSNELSDQSILYIFCDGPKLNASNKTIEEINEVRHIAKQNNWCKETIIIESELNKGLAKSIIEGVSLVLEKHGKIIVLEDDLITSRYFLRYMNIMLDKYQLSPSVFSVSADRPPKSMFSIPDDYEYDVFVSLRPFSYGWATWIDRWQKVDWSLSYYDDFIKSPYKIEAFNRGGSDLSIMLNNQMNGKIDSWAIQFAYAHFKNHCIALLPCQSYINNIGFDGTGIHSLDMSEQFFNDVRFAKKEIKLLDVLYEDSRILNSFFNYFHQFTISPVYKKPLLHKFINKIARSFSGHDIIKYKKDTQISKIFN